ncbi:RCC1 domain-containing protein, partial [Archangium sp.]|uniref:RCC1 domain-containing protein n=1 Tax=Archangium sp. TaxID=1872627 RepID=UPI0038D4BC10
MLVSLLVPRVARAQESTEVRTYLSSISRLYESLEYERALEQISNAKRLTRGIEDDVSLTLYEGLVLADMGKLDKASSAFKAALLLKPDAKLPVQVSPKVEQLFETLRQQVNPKPPPRPQEHKPEPQQPVPGGAGAPRAVRAPEIVEAHTSERSNLGQATLLLRIVARDESDGELGFAWEADFGTLETPTNTATTSEIFWKARTCMPKGLTPTVKATVTNSQGVSSVMRFPIVAAPCIVHAAGDKHSLWVRPDGTVWAWGNNQYGQLGDGTTATRSSPRRVSALSGVVALSAGYFHSLAVLQDGTVWAWGKNDSGQLGDGTTTQRSTPVRVSALSGVTSVSAGMHHSLAVLQDGTVWAWGNNESGHLGDVTTTQRSTPVQVRAWSGMASVSAGSF